jgi:Domain of unknown function (DUF4410)
MELIQRQALNWKYSKATTGNILLSAAIALCLIPMMVWAQGPVGAKVYVTPLESYSGSDPLPKPNKILVYDFAINPADIQVDKSQEYRPRHLVTGDESPQAIAKKVSAELANELVTKLEKTGIPVEHVTADTIAPDNALTVQGKFVSLQQGNKIEREGIGMGAGSADVQTTVDVHLKSTSNAVLVSQFQTDTKPAENMGAGVPAAAGVNPAAAAAKSKATDRKKTIDAYTSKTADVMAQEISKQMAKLGWIKVNDKGEVVP